jgi:hypothetical protein
MMNSQKTQSVLMALAVLCVVGVTAILPQSAFAGDGDFGGMDIGGGWVTDGITMGDGGGWVTDGVTFGGSTGWYTDGITNANTGWITDGITQPYNSGWYTDGITGGSTGWITDGITYGGSTGWTTDGITYGGSTGWITDGYTGGYGGSYTTPTIINQNIAQAYASAPASQSISAPSYSQPIRISSPGMSSGVGYSSGVGFGGGGGISYAPIYPAYPQTPVVYQQPTYPAPTCQLYQAQASSYGYGSYQPVTISWMTYNATSATLSNVGAVQVPSGYRQVYGAGTYTMQVHGQGGIGSCQVVVQQQYIPQPVPTPVPQPYPVPTPVPTPVPVPTPIPQPYPVPTPVPSSNLACYISASKTTLSNGESTILAWAATGAISAYLSDGLGNVAPTGTLSVRPSSSKDYVLTVRDGYGRTANCDVSVSVRGQYVSLTQIPYTGFDYGPMGDAIYWMSLLAFAIAAAYLVLYSTPRLAFSMPLLRQGFAGLASVRLPQVTMPRITFPKARIARKEVHAAPAPVVARTHKAVAAPAFLPTTQPQPVRATHDTMTAVAAHGESIPRIVIHRA